MHRIGYQRHGLSVDLLACGLNLGSDGLTLGIVGTQKIERAVEHQNRQSLKRFPVAQRPCPDSVLNRQLALTGEVDDEPASYVTATPWLAARPPTGEIDKKECLA